MQLLSYSLLLSVRNPVSVPLAGVLAIVWLAAAEQRVHTQSQVCSCACVGGATWDCCCNYADILPAAANSAMAITAGAHAEVGAVAVAGSG